MPSMRLPWTLWRRLAAATLWPFLAILAVLSALLLLLLTLRLGEVAPAAAFHTEDLLPLFAYGLPRLSLVTVPVAWLSALLLALGQFSADGAYLAARAAGLGPWRLTAPVLLLGVALSAGAFALSLEGEPWGNRRLRHEVVRLAKLGVVAGLRPGVFNDTLRELTFYIGSRDEDGTLHELLLFDRREPARPLVAVARTGRIVADPGAERLFFSLQGGELHAKETGGRFFRRATFERYEFELDLADFLSKRVSFLGPFDEYDVATMRKVIEDIRLMGHETWRYELAYHRKFALPATPLLFALFGIALGLGQVRAPRVRAALLAVLLIAAYYTLQRAGDGLLAQGAVPAWAAAWLPMLVLGPLALALAVRTTRGRR